MQQGIMYFSPEIRVFPIEAEKPFAQSGGDDGSFENPSDGGNMELTNYLSWD